MSTSIEMRVFSEQGDVWVWTPKRANLYGAHVFGKRSHKFVENR